MILCCITTYYKKLMIGVCHLPHGWLITPLGVAGDGGGLLEMAKNYQIWLQMAVFGGGWDENDGGGGGDELGLAEIDAGQ
jgi:hypothetical protein